MEKSSIFDFLIAAAGIVSFIVSIFPNISNEYKIMLWVISPAVLSIYCMFIFLNNQDEIKERLKEAEEKIKRAEDLSRIIGEIEYLKEETRYLKKKIK